MPSAHSGSMQCRTILRRQHAGLLERHVDMDLFQERGPSRHNRPYIYRIEHLFIAANSAVSQNTAASCNGAYHKIRTGGRNSDSPRLHHCHRQGTHEKFVARSSAQQTMHAWANPVLPVYQWMRNHTFNDLGQLRPQDLLPYFTARNENMPAATLDDAIQREGRLRRHSWR